MIRKLNSTDHEAVMALVAPEAAFNIFIVGDIENYGYNQDFLELWGDFNADNHLRAVLLRFYNSFLAYAPGDYDSPGFAGVMAAYPWKGLSGKQTVVDKLWPSVARGTRRRVTRFTALQGLLPKPTISLPAGYELRKAGVEHVDDLVLLSQICFGQKDPESQRQALRRELAQGVGTVWCAVYDGVIVSKAQTTAENSLSAIVVGVCTLPAHRGKGLATACTTKLCSEQLAQGRVLSLFWDNPIAGHIYEQMGFVDIGAWIMVERS